MNRQRKSVSALLGIFGLGTALFCFTVMLSGESCPAVSRSISYANSEEPLPPCHSTQTSSETDSGCTGCDLVFSGESVQLQNPELKPRPHWILGRIADVFSVTFPFSDRIDLGESPPTDRLFQHPSLLFLSSIRLLI
ncbi:hypothetical protein EHQ12_09205 [Leptospira gomenensis]|uniref:Uncharacterized protein n=1 Tax=Leptospira gomenensis TaxID=2484974 RepID=A0A5F1YHD6_9LEPT|nr:hypothetical protein [Leptospira gomenensis]TGK37505.1 hypothetical protein EHQ17_02850 [Leptospira gomenensis]TGK39489.1 hypothetical protein EHQ12_09205 [Leptospira gomenensis]TGK43089.1 hypothetical protein EHQ07_13145 [Leptospira gomenensis]TGK55082.1 hypothetical protein EHQ13_18065 [Leptospira gomenensis]